VGLYDGVTGLGIVACALLLSPLIDLLWAPGWWVLAGWLQFPVG
jgi:hypothetical protein